MFSFQRSSPIKLLFRLEIVLPDAYLYCELNCKLLSKSGNGMNPLETIPKRQSYISLILFCEHYIVPCKTGAGLRQEQIEWRVNFGMPQGSLPTLAECTPLPNKQTKKMGRFFTQTELNTGLTVSCHLGNVKSINEVTFM